MYPLKNNQSITLYAAMSDFYTDACAKFEYVQINAALCVSLKLRHKCLNLSIGYIDLHMHMCMVFKVQT